MARRFFEYIFLILLYGLSVSSCADDSLSDGTSGNGSAREIKGTLTLNLSTPDMSLRSRAVSTESGASLLLKNLWVGVFNTTTGACFGSKRYDELNQVLRSGVVFNKMINVDFVAQGEDFPLAYIVAVANYDDVTTWDGRNLEEILPDYEQHSSITWDDIINLDIDTRSAYAGDKGEAEGANAPFLAGFFQDATTLTQNPKVDQFSYEALGPTAIYPTAAAVGMDIQLSSPNDDNVYVAAGALCLRRLVSHNVINLNMSNGYEITDVKYKRFNMPRTVYVLQRRTDTTRRPTFEEWQRYSPNRADHLLTEGNYDAADATFPYASDSEWIPVELATQNGVENVRFVFDHFENKHWGIGNLQSQEDREALNPDGTFSALCSGTEDAYNNFASYFVLKMHIVNKLTGESADVEYTLHEGFCNTDDGRRAETLEEKCHDFGSFRNVNYNYNINIAGISDITASVTGSEGQPVQHPNGQTGNIWKMNYATGSLKTPIPVAGGTYDFNGQYLSFSPAPDLGFRIYGVGDSGNLIDVCYNLPDGMYQGFTGLWPVGQPTLFGKSDAAAAFEGIPQSLLDEMQIGSGSTFYNVVDFVKGIEKGTINPTGKYSIRFSSYENKSGGTKINFMRGIYIFDRNDAQNGADADGCSNYNVAYGAVQYPVAPEKVRFDSSNILWDNKYYSSVSSMTYVYAAEKQIFYGAECSAIDLRWKHDERFVGYKISVFNDNYTHPAITVSANDLSRYLHEVNGETVFIYPLSTAGFPRSTSTSANNYSFSVTPIVDGDIYEVEGPTVIKHNTNNDDATCIRLCPTLWDVSSTTDWKLLDLKDKSKVEVHYRGLNLYSEATLSQGTKGSFLSFGGRGTANDRYFSFCASVPGQFAVTAKSHSGADDATRELVVVQMNKNGVLTTTKGENYDELYHSNAMAGKSTTYTTPVFQLVGNQPTEFRLFTSGSVDFYKIQFIPAK